jgi:hypothetical protein
MTTPLKWRVGIDRLYEAGINQVVYHGFPYNHPGFPHPGYHPFSSPHMAMTSFSSDMSANDPLLTGAAPAINAYAARAQYLLQGSRTSSRVGVFYQLFDYPNGNFIQEELVQGVLDDQDAALPKESRIMAMIMPSSPNVTGDRKWVQDSAALSATLVANGHYPLYFNEDRLVRSHIEGKAVVMGEAAFEALIVFNEQSLTVEVAEKLAELAAAGIPVLFVSGLPDRNPGYLDHEERDQKVRQAVAAIGGPVCNGAGDVLAALAATGVQPEVRYDQPQPHVGFIHKVDRADGAEYFFLRNRTRYERSVTVSLTADDCAPVLLDLWTGRMAALRHEAANGLLRLNVRLAGYESALVMLADPAAAAGLGPAVEPVILANLEPVLKLADFAFTADQRLVNGTSRHIELERIALRDWREIPELAALSDPGKYTTTFRLSTVDRARRYFLQFDRVCDHADVTLNGQALDPLFVMPWRREITGLLHEGANTLQITVTPTLRNQLVGYANAGNKDYRQYKRAC